MLETFDLLKFFREGLKDKRPDRISIIDPLNAYAEIYVLEVFFVEGFKIKIALSRNSIEQFSGHEELLERNLLEEIIRKYDKEKESQNEKKNKVLADYPGRGTFVDCSDDGMYCSTCAKEHKNCRCDHIKS
jgi:hypothetical protein